MFQQQNLAFQGWQTEEVFLTGDNYFSRLLAEIESAVVSVDLEVYIFALDQAGEAFENALIRAAKRGIAVRLIVDGFGSAQWLNSPRSAALFAVVPARIFHPLPFQKVLTQFDLDGTRRSRWLQVLKGFAQINRRTHRKYAVIDGSTAWLSSMNVSSVHLETISGERAWHDVGARVTGSEVALFTIAFEWAWTHSSGFTGSILNSSDPKLPQLLFSPMVRLNSSLRLRYLQNRELRHRLLRAKDIVWISNPYILPPAFLLRSLGRAVRNGVDVRLLVSGRSDIPVMGWIAKGFYKTLLSRGVRIYEFQKTFIHAKTMLIDATALVGTSNLNSRSFRHDLEIDVGLFNESSVTQLRTQFLRNLEQSREIQLHHADLPTWRSLVGKGIAAIFGNWM